MPPGFGAICIPGCLLPLLSVPSLALSLHQVLALTEAALKAAAPCAEPLAALLAQLRTELTRCVVGALFAARVRGWLLPPRVAEHRTGRGPANGRCSHPFSEARRSSCYATHPLLTPSSLLMQ